MRIENQPEEVRRFLEDYLEEAGASRYVVGVSGGLDSALALKLAAEAVGPEKVSAWVMPGKPSSERNMEDARELIDELGADRRELDLRPLIDELESSTGFTGREAVGNTRARLRTVALYMEANSETGLVLGEGNRSEYLLVYFTKYGDSAADVKPLIEYYKTEIKKLARETGLPEKFIKKPPTAGLWKGQTDEDELGLPYSRIDPVLKKRFDQGLDLEDFIEDVEASKSEAENLLRRASQSRHKRQRPASPGLTGRMKR